MIYLCQRDLKWANIKLGISQLTVGRFGCTTTCISMLSDYYGDYKSPALLANQKDLYTSDGLILWNKIPSNKFWMARRIQGRDDVAIKASLDGANSAVLLQVNDGQHWVLPIRKTWFTNDYICVDPWTGKTCGAISDYKNITGSAHFLRK